MSAVLGADARRWLAALLLVLAVHALVLLLALYWIAPTPATPPAVPAMLVDLLPPAAPPTPPVEQPPGPRQVRAEPVRPRPQAHADPVRTPPLARPEVAVPAAAPQPPAPQQLAPPAEASTAPAQPPVPPAPQRVGGLVTWQGRVLAALDKAKRYPRSAQFARQQGVPWIRFAMDRQGQVLSVALERGSGLRVLDEAALELPRRAQPLPLPPPDVPGERIELVAPVEFFMR